MFFPALTNEQRLLYYHLIDYPKIITILELALNLSCIEAESNTKRQLVSAFEVIKANCIAACDCYGARIGDSVAMQELKSQMTLTQLSDLGLAAFQDVMNITNPLLALLRCESRSLNETPPKQRIRDLLSDVLVSIQRTLPVGNEKRENQKRK